MNPDLLSKLESCGTLPELPVAAVRIVELAGDQTATMADVALAVAEFPAANDKILQLTNSPVYGSRRHSTNLRQAVTLIGIHATLMITLSFAVFASQSEARRRRLDLNLFWRRSLLAATAGRVLAHRWIKRSAEEAFLGAMVQDIGVLALDAAVDGLYDQQIDGRQLDHEYLTDYERRRTGSDHAEVGSWLLQRWQFPEHLCRAVAVSHDLVGLAGVDDQPLSRCVALAGLIADNLLGDAQQAHWVEVQAHAQRYRAGDHGFLQEVLAHLADDVPVVSSLFRVPLLDDKQINEMKAGTPDIVTVRRETVRTAPAPARSARELLGQEALAQSIAEEFALAVAHEWPISLVVVEVDPVGVIDKAQGPETDDAAAGLVANQLVALLRDSDVIGRFGHQQTIALLPGTDLPGARIVGARIVTAIRNAELEGRHGSAHITVSAGLVSYSKTVPFGSAEEMLSAAREAVIQARAAGGDQLVVHARADVPPQ